jgi:hypothetical protein
MLGLEKYTYFTNHNGLDYEFESIGPKGIIKKVARFSKMKALNTFNFGFGDLNEVTGEIDDTISSNNADQEKIIGTLGNIIVDFLHQNINSQIYIEGTDVYRTRFYQIYLSRYYDELNKSFLIFGFKDRNWSSFKKGVNYEAFLGRIK